MISPQLALVQEPTTNIPELALVRMIDLKVRHHATVEEIDELLALLRPEKALVEQRVDETAALITPPHYTDTRETEYQRDGAKLDLLLLTRGLTIHDGISNERLKDRIGRPGLSQLQRLEVKLLDLRERAVAREKEQWPRDFRYTGRPGGAHVDGRRLDRGDVASLTEAQATAWADRFEEVTVTEPVAEPVASS